MLSTRSPQFTKLYVNAGYPSYTFTQDYEWVICVASGVGAAVYDPMRSGTYERVYDGGNVNSTHRLLILKDVKSGTKMGYSGSTRLAIEVVAMTF